MRRCEGWRRVRAGARRAARSAARVAALLLAAQAGSAAAMPAEAAAEPRCAAAPARLAGDEFAAEFWALTARFDSGHHLFVEFTITNVGVGDRNGAVIGHLVAPDGAVRAFRKAKREGAWRLSDDGLRIEIGKVTLDRRCPVERLEVTRDDLAVQLAFRPGAPALASDLLQGRDRGFELLEAAGPAEGTLWTADMQHPVAVQGRVALTHRWVETLESRVVLRRLEFFSLGGEDSLYFTEAMTPEGSSARWLVVEEGGRTSRQSGAFEVTSDWGMVDAEGFARLDRLELAGSGLSGHVDVSSPLVRYDALRDLPAPLRLALSLSMRWRTAWSPAPFELRIEGDGRAARRLSGVGILHVTSFNPDPTRGVALPTAME
jgi:hypothetical protein